MIERFIILKMLSPGVDREEMKYRPALVSFALHSPPPLLFFEIRSKLGPHTVRSSIRARFVTYT